MLRFLNDDLTPNEWQQRRSLQLSSGDPNGGINPSAPIWVLNDGLPSAEWRRVRALQASGSPQVAPMSGEPNLRGAPSRKVRGAGSDGQPAHGVGFAAGVPAPRSERQWEVEAAQASRGPHQAGDAAGGPLGSLFGRPATTPTAPSKPAAPPRPQYTRRDAALDLGARHVLQRIAIGEQPDRPVSYDLTYGYGAFVPPGSKKITEMTFDEVAALQAEMLKRQAGNRGIHSSVVGMYQFKASEVERLRGKLGLKPTDLFTAGVQDMMARERLEELGYSNFLAGKLDMQDFQEKIAGNRASVASAKTGRSRHNQRTATSSAQVQAALAAAKAEAQHLITDLGVDPYERRWR